jgi:hypothetical protein
MDGGRVRSQRGGPTPVSSASARPPTSNFRNDPLNLQPHLAGRGLRAGHPARHPRSAKPRSEAARWTSGSIAIAGRLSRPGLFSKPAPPPISGYAPHPDRSEWLLVVVLLAVLYLVLTIPS